MNTTVKQYLVYLLRWQLSTPIAATVLNLLADMPVLWATVIANLVGAIIMFPIDRFIFLSDRKKNQQGK